MCIKLVARTGANPVSVSLPEEAGTQNVSSCPLVRYNTLTAQIQILSDWGQHVTLVSGHPRKGTITNNPDTNCFFSLFIRFCLALN